MTAPAPGRGGRGDGDPGAAGPDRSRPPQPAPRDDVLSAAMRALGARGTPLDVDALRERLHDAGRQRLADLLAELTRACLAERPHEPPGDGRDETPRDETPRHQTGREDVRLRDEARCGDTGRGTGPHRVGSGDDETAPRRVEAVAQDIAHLARRLGVDSGWVAGLPRTTPAPDAALEGARRCVAMLEALEGRSDRVRRLSAACRGPRPR